MAGYRAKMMVQYEASLRYSRFVSVSITKSFVNEEDGKSFDRRGRLFLVLTCSEGLVVPRKEVIEVELIGGFAKIDDKTFGFKTPSFITVSEVGFNKKPTNMPQYPGSHMLLRFQTERGFNQTWNFLHTNECKLFTAKNQEDRRKMDFPTELLDWEKDHVILAQERDKLMEQFSSTSKDSPPTTGLQYDKFVACVPRCREIVEGWIGVNGEFAEACEIFDRTITRERSSLVAEALRGPDLDNPRESISALCGRFNRLMDSFISRLTHLGV